MESGKQIWRNFTVGKQPKSLEESGLKSERMFAIREGFLPVLHWEAPGGFPTKMAVLLLWLMGICVWWQASRQCCGVTLARVSDLWEPQKGAVLNDLSWGTLTAIISQSNSVEGRDYSHIKQFSKINAARNTLTPQFVIGPADIDYTSLLFSNCLLNLFLHTLGSRSGPDPTSLSLSLNRFCFSSSQQNG